MVDQKPWDELSPDERNVVYVSAQQELQKIPAGTQRVNCIKEAWWPMMPDIHQARQEGKAWKAIHQALLGAGLPKVGLECLQRYHKEWCGHKKTANRITKAMDNGHKKPSMGQSP